MKLIVFIAFYIFSTCFVFSQASTEKNNRYNLSAKIGIGATKFDVSGFLTEDYPALVVRMGGSISKAIIGNSLQLESGLSIYYRAKSKSPLKNDIYWYGKGSSLPRLHETAIQRHIAFEVPISVRYLLKGGRSVNAGFMVRKWSANDLVDLFASQTEFAYILGVNQRILTDFIIGIDVDLGITDFYHGQVIGGSGGIVIKNKSALISLAYAF
ncbi:MAG: hypothetical protein ACNS60_13105 [Candidatus Cyclobacteriaceae bacterium M2_1C_046]